MLDAFRDPNCDHDDSFVRNDSATALDLVHDAYRRLSHEQLVLFLTVRSLPVIGSDEELASRLAHFDIHTYNIPAVHKDIETCTSVAPHTIITDDLQDSCIYAPPPSPPDSTNFAIFNDHPKHARLPRVQSLAPDLPVELIAEIMDRIGDWELSKAVGVPTYLPRPPSWNRSTQTDEAILTGYLPLIRAADPACNPPTKVGASLAIRFGYVHVLEYFLTQHRGIFLNVFCHRDLIPIDASHHGRISVLSWWKNALDHHPELPRPNAHSVCSAIDRSSRNGQVASLDWWLYHSCLSPNPTARPLPFEYTDAPLENASLKNHVGVLQWWKTHSLSPPHLTLKPGRSLDLASMAGHTAVLEWWATSSLEFKYDKLALYYASCHGKVDVLKWWLQSGFRLMFDGEALVGATKHNRPEVLEWWDKSGLEVQYRLCDIEEALEDAIGGGEAAREWWRTKGVDFNATDKEWTQLRSLN
ncbi:hypothetical protein JAAARDRAFT_208857 [Jaapia argillacea MUCL 33604]|uniref:Uncharacterized protein n=1 Tax=Jaapia argillacea MUCL 33604 TaxID=933084 RepID=A0A067PJY6_9AGAM|nr:hypothetical protein JAAARDRAFT_208857 [Jaapia argillacea MUCL 33604]